MGVNLETVDKMTDDKVTAVAQDRGRLQHERMEEIFEDLKLGHVMSA